MPRTTMFLVQLVGATGVIESVMVPSYDREGCEKVYERAFERRPSMQERVLADTCVSLVSTPINWGRLMLS